MEKSSQNYMVLPLWVLAVLALGTAMWVASDIFLWLAASFFLFALLDPAFLFLRRHKISNALSAFVLIIVAICVVIAVLALVIHFSTNIVVELEESKRTFLRYYQSAVSAISNLSSGFSHSTDLPKQLSTPSVQKVELVQSSPFSGGLGSTLMRGLGSAMTVLTFSFLWPVLTFFLLLERHSLAQIIPQAFKNPDRGAKMWSKIVLSVRAYFLGNLVLALVTYPIFVGLFFAFGVHSKLTLAALASVFNLIPFLGSLLSGFLPALAMLSQGESVTATLLLYGSCVVIHFSIANFVTPKVLGSRVDINATTSTISLILWGELWGGLGLLLAIPLTATIKIVMENSGFYWLEWSAALMSEKAVKLNSPSRPDLV
jgi:predicted PurR-regulated permease PerM